MNKIKAFFLSIINFMSRHFGPTVARIRMQHPRNQLYPFLVTAVILFILFLSVFFGSGQTRRVFFFPDARTGSIRSEARYLEHSRTSEEDFQYYVRELLLGPVSPLALPLFNRPVQPVSVFIRGDTAYINLPASVLMPEVGVAETIIGYSFFKKNVFANFPKVDKIYLYIDGIEVYVSDPAVQGPGGL